MMMLTQYLESRFFQFELQMLFARKHGNFEKSGQLVRVAKIAPTLLIRGRMKSGLTSIIDLRDHKVFLFPRMRLSRYQLKNGFIPNAIICTCLRLSS